MSTAVVSGAEPRAADLTGGRGRLGVVDVLLACGVAYSLSYVVANDVIAATRYGGYDRASQAVSELSATGAPTRAFLAAMVPVWTGLMVAFGIGVWKAARTERSLRVEGGLLVAFGITGLLWLAFPMTSRQDMVSGSTPTNDVGHIAMTVVTVVLILSQLLVGAAAFGRRFRLYSYATAAVVLVFGALTAMEAPKVPDGQATPWMGVFERINIAAWLLWIAVLAIALLRARRQLASVEGPSDRG
jgi:hypothetical protein